jgi:hypothetical protein
MATHGDHRTKGDGAPRPLNGSRSTPGSFAGLGGDHWHRALTGRQSPEPVSAKLRMIYGNIVAEPLPDRMCDLLSQLDHKVSDRK